MPKTQKKLSDFFGSRRRKCTLITSSLLKSKGNEKRMKLTVSMPLSNTDMQDIPTDFLSQFRVMETEDSASNRCMIEVEFNSMAIRIFSTDTIIEPSVPTIQGALLHHFAMIGEGTGEKRRVSLDFLIYLPATKALHDWEWDHVHAELHLEAIQSQGSLDLSSEAEEDDEDEEEQMPLHTARGRNEDVVVVPASAKSGPKQLTEFHANEVNAGRSGNVAQMEPPAGRGRRKPN